MIEIKIQINKDCKSCKEGLKYFKTLQKRNKNNYANMNMKTYEFIAGILFTPDFNSSGFLTHFHITKADKDSLKEISKNMEKQDKASKTITKLKKEGKWCKS